MMQMNALAAPTGQRLAPANVLPSRPIVRPGVHTTTPSTHHTAQSGVCSRLSVPQQRWSSSIKPTAAVSPTAAAAAPTAAAADSLRGAAVALAKVADDTKALDISVLHVEPVVSWTSYMVLCTVMSKPQLLAVLSRMEDAAAQHGLAKQNSAGSSQWEVLDFGSIVVHVFTADQRDYYDLDSFYALAEEVELPFVSATAAAGPDYQQQQYAAEPLDSSGVGGLWSKSL